ncbi:hypothetical protein ACIBG7_09180 [Nonomuraea sp. NPDC050328]|uniref:hypothetical protein n=1 Tax=Nonomuraea sp. NPDC050328 TaxID=3364361 RepID=UPI0037882738
MNLRVVAPKAWGALVIGLFALVVRLSSLSTVSLNGKVTSCSYTDFAGIGLGGLSVLLALVAGWEVATGLRTDARKAPTLAVMAVACLLGVVGVMKGLGMIWSPCTG